MKPVQIFVLAGTTLLMACSVQRQNPPSASQTSSVKIPAATIQCFENADGSVSFQIERGKKPQVSILGNGDPESAEMVGGDGIQGENITSYQIDAVNTAAEACLAALAPVEGRKAQTTPHKEQPVPFVPLGEPRERKQWQTKFRMPRLQPQPEIL